MVCEHFVTPETINNTQMNKHIKAMKCSTTCISHQNIISHLDDAG